MRELNSSPAETPSWHLEVTGDTTSFSHAWSKCKKRSHSFKWVLSHFIIPSFLSFLIFKNFLLFSIRHVGHANLLIGPLSWSTVIHCFPPFFQGLLSVCTSVHVLTVTTVIFSFSTSLLSLTCVNRLYSHRSQPLFQYCLLVTQILGPCLDGKRASHI